MHVILGNTSFDTLRATALLKATAALLEASSLVAARGLPLSDSVANLLGDLLGGRALAEGVDELAQRVHEVEEDTAVSYETGNEAWRAVGRRLVGSEKHECPTEACSDSSEGNCPPHPARR